MLEFRLIQNKTILLTVGFFYAVMFLIPCCQAGKKLTSKQLEFFENHIRPILVKNCYECHHSGKDSESDVALDYRTGFRKGGENGSLVDFENPDKSLLLKVLRHEIDGLEMPVGGKKLNRKTIEQFRQWLKMGAPDPRDHPPSEKEIAKAASWESIRDKRKEWWSFQPVRKSTVPHSRFSSWSSHPVDQFIAEKNAHKKLAPNKNATKRKLIRRLSFALTGLPPSPEEVEKYLNNQSANAYENLVDQYLASPHFGERWARHWMDWVRYTDTHGSEGDPAIPHAYRYRDYLIRAINQDVPYDQLVKEHVAGDLLSNPRINRELGINESALGIAHWRMVFHGFSPTDPLDEKVRFTDDQINVFSKAFLGLTVSCARCHNHKFDAISQKDYYALFGILGSTRPATIDVNLPEKQNLHKKELSGLKKEIRTGVADVWLDSARTLSKTLLDSPKEIQQILKNAKNPENPFHLWKSVSTKSHSEKSVLKIWNEEVARWKKSEAKFQQFRSKKYFRKWDMSTADQDGWFRDGAGLAEISSLAGEFHLAESGDQLITGIYPAGVYSHLFSNKHRGILHSRRIILDGEYDLWFRTIGSGSAMNRYVVQNYPRSGTIYKVGRISDGKWQWRKFDLGYWKGDQIHLEISTAADQAVLVTGQQRSWFGVRDVIICKKNTFDPSVTQSESLNPIFKVADNKKIDSLKDLAQVYENVLVQLIQNWKSHQITDSQALLLDQFLRSGILPNQLNRMQLVKSNIESYRKLESEIPVPTRSPGLLEADSFDQPFMERGNHKNLKEPVPRRFLESIDPTPYKTKNSGRLKLAEDLLREDNPFTSRVIVNRLWHYVFGQGIVKTTDNFGRLGEEPTHPELLDFLATKMKEDQWSIKKMIRFLVMSKTFQQNSIVSVQALKIDPSNQLLSHSNLRRLDAEAIRDSLLMVSGELDQSQFGPGFSANGQGKKRSVYMKIRRNSLDEFLKVFDAPVPFATKGRRDITNVPAQSLTLLNNKWVIQISEKWVENLFKKYPALSDEDRVNFMYKQAFGAPPSHQELYESVQYLNILKKQYSEDVKQFAAVTHEINNTKILIQNLLKPARDGLAKEKNVVSEDISVDQPVPDSLWQFNGNANDLIGNLHGKLHGSAIIQDGALIIDGNGFMKTVPIKKDVREKTLEAWVMLDTLDQAGGGVMTIQTLNGITFDSMVYAERKSKRWLAGSNSFQRTLDFNGQDETEAVNNPILITIVYEQDGTIRCYRNGKPYGKSIRKSASQSFKANDSQILFGLRHGTPGGNRLLKGKILEARLYLKALSEKEVHASARMNQAFISEDDIIQKLSEVDKKRLVQFRKNIKRFENQVEQIKPGLKEKQAWNDFAHALFNLKRFIYID